MNRKTAPFVAGGLAAAYAGFYFLSTGNKDSNVVKRTHAAEGAGMPYNEGVLRQQANKDKAPPPPTSEHNPGHETTQSRGPPGQSGSADDPSRTQPTPQRPQPGREGDAVSKSPGFKESYSQARPDGGAAKDNQQ